MKLVLTILILSFSGLSWAEKANNLSDVRVGDAVAAVQNHLGAPKIEFPLRGQLVQDYGYCVITSSNGVVTAIKERREPSSKKKEKLLTVEGLMAGARAGDAESQYCLAYCYQVGEAVTKNMDEAIRWYTLAAMQGHMAAQHNLGVIYMNGEGVPQDYEQAYTWAVLAAKNGNSDLKRLLVSHLTADQQKSASLRAQRILDGLEESPYGSPDAKTAVAKKNPDRQDPAAD